MGKLPYIEMNVLCESGKVACDALVRQFEALNEHIGVAKRQNAEHRIAPGEASADSKNMAEIKVTTDSAAGWLPSAEQQAEISRAVKMFLAALDAGEYATAYALMTPGQQALETAEAFEHRVSKFNTEAGSVQERRMVKVTWTKDPANAPAPGVYAAVDLASRFENIDRHCGYVVLYQRDAVAPWRVTRQEDSYMTNEQARQIEQRQSRQAVNDLWGKMSQHCPNYAGATAAETK